MDRSNAASVDVLALWRDSPWSSRRRGHSMAGQLAVAGTDQGDVIAHRE